MRFLLSAGALAATAAMFVTAGWSGNVDAATCTAAQLHGAFTVIPNSAGLGSISYRLRLENRSHGACSFPRHPSVQLYGFRHRPTPTHTVFPGAQDSVSIPARRALVADARFSPDVPSQGEPLRKACERVSHWLRVGPVTVAIKPPTRVCGFGAMAFRALHLAH